MGWNDWIHLAQDMDQWQALANKEINVWVSQYVKKFLSS
jgi:hypothetical protein